MEIYLGTKGLDQTWQERHPKTTKCQSCGKTARIGFVAIESSRDENGECVADLRLPTDHIWPHDFISAAIYFCPVCGEITTLWDQA